TPPAPLDRIFPAADSPNERGMTWTVERARPVRILAGGRDLRGSGWGLTPRQLPTAAGIPPGTYDEALPNGCAWGADQALAAVTVQQNAPRYDRGFAWESVRTEPLEVRIYRSVPVVVHEDDLSYTIDTTAQTVGEAVRRSGVILYLGDRVQPSLGSAV